MKRCLSYLCLLVLLSNSSLIQTLVVWEDSFVVNVTDDDVKWRKKIHMPVGTTTIHAVTQDITIHLPHDTILFASEVGVSTLDLKAEAGRTITVDIDEKLDFRPSPVNDNDFVIRWTGAGSVNFQIARKDD